MTGTRPPILYGFEEFVLSFLNLFGKIDGVVSVPQFAQLLRPFFRKVRVLQESFTRPLRMSVNHFSSFSSHPGRRGDERNEGRSAPFERLQIKPLVVGSAGLPAAVDDPDPLEGQRADGGVVTLAPALL